MTLSARTRLGPYEILSPLGSGGMGEVYRARDSKLDRDVAVKVLPAHFADDPEALARFGREAKAVAALSHPNILSIHDFGVQDGVTYAVMELLEGETLRGRLQAPIPQKQAVDYALQLARGLSAAHERGIVHRDLKPENLFVTKDGHLKILDFGLAKKIEAVALGEETSAPTVSGHTEPGTLLGTLGYMSPEQVKGFAVDHRSDIFSFGTILYEMLSGKKPFSRPTASETIAAILKEEPPELSTSGRIVSPALDRIVRHCLEKDRERRFHSVHDIVFALEETSSPSVTGVARGWSARTGKRNAFIVAAVLLILVVVGVVRLRRSPLRGGEAGNVRRLAVLPFENLGSSDDDYFADGVTDEVRGKLTTLPGLQVIARSSSIAYKKTTKTPKQIARELDVGYLLTATLRWDKSGGGSRVHVSPELVVVSGSGAPTSKWQQPFDAALTDIFQVQSDIATRVAGALGLALEAGEERRLSERPTQDLAAYDAFLRGEEALGGGGMGAASLRRALGFYEQAVALDPGFAKAWARGARSYALLYRASVPDPELAERARQAAERAAALAPDRPEGHLALGSYESLIVGDYKRALEEHTKAHRLAPGSADPLLLMARNESPLGRWEASIEHLRQAEHLDPQKVEIKETLGFALLALRRYPESREAFDRGLALAPANLDLIEEKAMTFLAQGDLAGARASLKAATQVDPASLAAFLANYYDLVWVLDDQQLNLLLRLTPGAFDNDRGSWALCLTQGYALKRDRAEVRTYAEEGRKVFEEQLRATPQDAQRHALLGLVLAYLGQKTEAIREGELAVALQPVTKSTVDGPYMQHRLVRIYMLVGEPEKALDKLEPLLKVPYYLSPGWLEIDPNFDPLRKNPRFQKLVARAK